MAQEKQRIPIGNLCHRQRGIRGGYKPGQEIVRLIPITYLPKAPEFVEGVLT